MGVKERALIMLDLDNDENKALKIDILLDDARDFILNYCWLDEIPSTLDSVLLKMVIFDYQKLTNESISARKEGDLSESYIQSYPDNIMTILNSNRRVRV
ncbi:phage head-tail connector protein [Cytobacillus kochii]|uniref:phage head-tail connector protein n=1 Tax=Cytobacillus kochii TaxID=859143 RepID=UPI001CD437DE|nr:phage head-tail connector protein [Cytobacillus kochii]MCA1027341.1 phage head-tail connector protein [Cytobacillus kochii]